MTVTDEHTPPVAAEPSSTASARQALWAPEAPSTMRPHHARAIKNAPVQLELHLESFDGPLELLLLLIEQRRLPITQVSLAQVADQYLAQVHALPALDADLLADFLVIA